jgi:hypothetical protein
MKYNRILLIIFVLISIGLNAQNSSAKRNLKDNKTLILIEPRLKKMVHFIEQNEIDSCLQFFDSAINMTEVKDSFLKARKSVLQLKNFSHNSFGFSNSKGLASIIYINNDFHFIYELLFTFDKNTQNKLFNSIELKGKKHFDELYKHKPDELPPTTPPPPPSSPPPPPK